MVFGNGVKNMQAAAYNGARTVLGKVELFHWKLYNLNIEVFEWSKIEFIFQKTRKKKRKRKGSPKRRRMKKKIRTTVSFLIWRPKPWKNSNVEQAWTRTRPPRFLILNQNLNCNKRFSSLLKRQSHFRF